MVSLRVAIAEDSWVMRDLLKRQLGVVIGLEIVGIAENGIEALDITTECDPDVLILDISMPILGGIDVLKRLRERASSPVVIMFTAETSLAVQNVCLEAGADFFVGKTQLNRVVDICRQRMLMT